MRNMAYFLVPEQIAERSGTIEHRYRTKDGRFILNETDMKGVRLTPEEYISGLDVEILSESRASELIKENGYQMGIQIDSENVTAEEEESGSADVEPTNPS